MFPTQSQTPQKAYVVVAFWLTGGTNVTVALEQQEAERVFAQYQQGTLKGTNGVIGHHNIACAPNTTPWSLSVASLTAINVIHPEVIKQQQSAVQPGKFPTLGKQDLSGFMRPMGN